MDMPTPDRFQEIAASLAAQMTEIAAQGKTRDGQIKELTAKLDAIHDALMVPQPGQEKSLLERFALATIWIESMGRMGRVLVAVLGLLALLGVSIKIGIAEVSK